MSPPARRTPETASARASSTTTSPRPPASTTPARRSDSSMVGVSASASRAPCAAASTTAVASAGTVLDPGSCRIRRGAGHREDGALDGTRDRLVAEVGSTREQPVDGRAVERIPVGQSAQDLAGTAQDLGEDHAGVAAGPHQCAGRHRPSGLVHARVACRVGPALVDGLAGGLHRQVEVGAGVAVRHGEHVEGVDLDPGVTEAAESPLGPVAHERRRHDCGHLPASFSHDRRPDRTLNLGDRPALGYP